MRRFWAICGLLILGALIGIGAWVSASRFGHRSMADEMPSSSENEQHKSLWTCAMHPQVIEDHPGDCPICHMKLVPMRSDDATGGAGEKRKILYWWDPMLGPSSIADKPGKSAMGMDRVPVYADDVSAGPAVTVDPVIVQNMGVRTAEVKRGSLAKEVRAVGLLNVPEPAMRDISLKVGGWIDTLQADTEGMYVKAGQPLFAFYSPDVVVAEDELIAAMRAEKSLEADAPVALREQTHSLVESAKRKLGLWDIAETDIDLIAKADHSSRTVVIRSPISGHVIDKSVVPGSAVTAGMKVMRIEDHSHLWLDAEIYASDFEGVAVGQAMEAAIEGLPQKVFNGTVSFIYPHVDHMTRTLLVRATFDNLNMTLRPGMYATAKIASRPVSDAILVPTNAVIDTGSEQIAFVADGHGHFEPRRLTLGKRGDDDVEVWSGLAPGEAVVTSGQFLLDVESNTKAAIARLQAANPATMQTVETTAMPSSMPAMAMDMTMPMASTTQAMGKLAVLHCPMKKADWLQIGDDTHNPYFGTAMESCGSVSTHLPEPTDPQLKAIVGSYLKIADELSHDQFSQQSVSELKAAVERSESARATALHQSVDGLSRASDLAVSRTAFQAVSADLIALLKGGTR